MLIPDANPSSPPLASRLRAEAFEWETEEIAELLHEAAEGIELLAAELAQTTADRDMWKRTCLHYQSLLGERGLL